MNRFLRWGFRALLLWIVNLFVGTLVLSLFTNGAVFTVPDFHLLSLFLTIVSAFFAATVLLSSPPRTPLKSLGLTLFISIGVLFSAMLSASLYIAIEEPGHVIDAVLHSLFIMAPVLTVSGAPLIIPLLAINFIALEVFRRRSKTLSR